MEINKFNIMLVDDVSFYKSLLQSHLDFMSIKYNIEYCSSVNLGIEKLNKLKGTEEQINLIICDLMMPEKSGIDFLKELKILNEFKDLPFILITSESDKEKLLEALSSGADAFLPKPWSVDDFKNALDSALKNKGIKYIAV